MGEIRVRVGPRGRAALHAQQEFATRCLEQDADLDTATDFVVQFVRAVDPRERDRALEVVRRGSGPRLTLPGRSA